MPLAKLGEVLGSFNTAYEVEPIFRGANDISHLLKEWWSFSFDGEAVLRKLRHHVAIHPCRAGLCYVPIDVHEK